MTQIFTLQFWLSEVQVDFSAGWCQEQNESREDENSITVTKALNKMKEKIACEYYLLPDVEAGWLKIQWDLIQSLKSPWLSSVSFMLAVQGNLFFYHFSEWIK